MIQITERADRFWHDRIIEMVRHVTWDGTGFSTISDFTIENNWPLNNTKFVFTRDFDGQRFKGFMNKKKFLVKPLN